MTALFINIKIDNNLKFDFFKNTLADIESQFDECHIKIRGKFKKNCIAFTKKLFSNRAKFYQHLQENNWIAASLIMIENVKSRSIFIYLEDHKLVAPLQNLNLILKNFDKYKLDYLCYSFFKSSKLGIKNLLPLNPQHNNFFSQFLLDKKNIQILSKISPLYNISSVTGIYSTHYIKKLLYYKNKKFSFYFRKLISVLSIIFPFPKYRIIINCINNFLGFFNFKLAMEYIDAPGIIEELITATNISEMNLYQEKFKYAVLKKELFLNYDDDNGVYGESLIKKGLYPFDTNKKINLETPYQNKFIIKLSSGEIYDCSYYSYIDRIRILPRILIKVNSGELVVKYKNKDTVLKKNDHQIFYTNLSPLIKCIKKAKVSLTIYDECFK